MFQLLKDSLFKQNLKSNWMSNIFRDMSLYNIYSGKKLFCATGCIKKNV